MEKKVKPKRILTKHENFDDYIFLNVKRNSSQKTLIRGAHIHVGNGNVIEKVCWVSMEIELFWLKKN